MNMKKFAIFIALLLGIALVPANASATQAPVSSTTAYENYLNATYPNGVGSKGTLCDILGVCGNFVVDPASPGPGVYCIPNWSTSVHPSQLWKGFVWKGQYASWIDACTGGANNNDVDGWWIDPNHRVELYRLIPSCSNSWCPLTWRYYTTYHGGSGFKVEDNDTNSMLRVQNGW